MRPLAAGVLGTAAALLCSCTRQTMEEVGSAAAERQLLEIFEGVRIDPERGVVEFDAVVAIDCHDPETPDVYLEVVCCTPDTREHEALVVTRVAPSLVHAAMLAIGAAPGSPAAWREESGSVVGLPPLGDVVRVSLVALASDGAKPPEDPGEWIVQAGTGRTLREVFPDTAWVFAGSRMREFRGREVYDADGTGQLIGLHTFGSETIAWRRVESPDSWVDEPEWLARADVVPVLGTPVTVRLQLVGRMPGSPEKPER